jgi:rod shape-determining protein MreC
MLFAKRPGAGYLLVTLLVLSAAVIWFDSNGRRLVQSGSVDQLEGASKVLWHIRSAVLSLATPIYVMAEAPYALYGSAADISSDRQSLLQQREQLSTRLLQLEEGQQRVLFLQAENSRLRQLLGSKAQLPSQATIAEIIGIPPDPDRAAVILDKGRDDGVLPGHAVVDAQGLFGQVVDVSSSTSWVILISDRKHAVPARNNRTGVRMIVGGIGVADRLVLEDLPASTDLQDGDLIETSGLGGRFPPGYPVGTIASVESTHDSPYLQALLKPTAALMKLGHVLVIAASEVAEETEGDIEMASANPEESD